MTREPSRAQVVFLYFITAAISLIAFILANKIWHADLRVPFSYAWYGDAIEPRTKQLLEGTWFHDTYLAAPFGQDSIAIAQLNVLKWGIQWILVELTRSPFLTQNLFEMLDPVLGSMTFLFAATRLGVSYAAAIPMAVLYGNLFVLYWRVLAGQAIEAAYWIVPLGCLALLQIARPIRLTREGTQFAMTREGYFFLGTAVLIGLESHYEVFFMGALAIAATLVGCIQGRSFQALSTGRTFIVVMAISFAVNLSPTLLWSLTHHEHPYTYARNPVEAYLYSVSLSQLILPNSSHRIPLFAHVRQAFDDVIPMLSNENAAAALGLAGTIGLCILCVAIVARGAWKTSRFIEHASYLTIAAIALAAPGGLGAIFSRFITPDVRAYNRISSWIAFFCLLAVSYVLEQVWQRLRNANRVPLYVGLAALIIVGGVLDQSPDHTPPYQLSAERAADDSAWIERIEQTLPANAGVLQIPYSDNYEALLAEKQQVPYLYSQGLRWSMGAFAGMRGATFENHIATLEPRAMVDAALASGFAAILIYRSDMPQDSSFEARLTSIVGKGPMLNSSGGQALYTIYQLRKAPHN